MPDPRSVLLDTYLDKRDTLIRVFGKSLRDPAQAEDLIQDLYVKITALDIDYAIDNPTGFLFRMANNLYLNRLRSRASDQNRDQAWHEVHKSQFGNDLVDEAPSAEEELAGRQQLRLVMETLGQMPEKTQDIFRLHKFDGLTQPQVAARLGISISSVEKHLSSALRQLTAKLQSGP